MQNGGMPLPWTTMILWLDVYKRQEDDEEHYEEYQRRVSDREVLSDMEHRCV